MPEKANCLQIHDTSKVDVPVVFCADANYGLYLPVVLQSIIDNASENYHYKIFILDIGISEDITGSIQEQIRKKENFSLEIHKISNWIKKYETIFKTRNHWSKATYGRFLIPDICAQYEKVIYADVDIIFNRDIADLMAMDLGENYIAGVPEIIDECRRFMEPELEQYYREVLKLTENQLSVNAGVLLFNVRQWRELGLSATAIKLLDENDFHLLDQDAINSLCRGNIYYLDFSWNCVSWAYHYIKKEQSRIAKEVNSHSIALVESYLQAREEEKKVFHYNEPSKPWNSPKMWGAESWWRCAAETPLFTWYLRKLSVSAEKRAERNRSIKKYCFFGLRLAKVITSKKIKKYYLFGIRYYTIKMQEY